MSVKTGIPYVQGLQEYDERRLNGNDPIVKTGFKESRSIGHPNLFHHVRPMGFHGFAANAKLVADFPVGAAEP